LAQIYQNFDNIMTQKQIGSDWSHALIFTLTHYFLPATRKQYWIAIKSILTVSFLIEANPSGISCTQHLSMGSHTISAILDQ